MAEARDVKASMESLPVFLIEQLIDSDKPDADPAPKCSRENICAIDVGQSAIQSGSDIEFLVMLTVLIAKAPNLLRASLCNSPCSRITGLYENVRQFDRRRQGFAR